MLLPTNPFCAGPYPMFMTFLQPVPCNRSSDEYVIASVPWSRADQSRATSVPSRQSVVLCPRLRIADVFRMTVAGAPRVTGRMLFHNEWHHGPWMNSQ